MLIKPITKNENSKTVRDFTTYYTQPINLISMDCALTTQRRASFSSALLTVLSISEIIQRRCKDTNSGDPKYSEEKKKKKQTNKRNADTFCQ